MTTAVSLFGGPKGQLPDHIKNAFGGKSNVGDGISVPSLSYEGKVWSVSIGGEKRSLIRVNDDGDEEPISIMRVVILDFNQRRGRTYYEGTYNADQPGSPLCWSKDGIEPDPAVPEDVREETTSNKCATCPMAVKGSRITENGKEVAACSEHRMLAVVPANKLDSTPLRLKIAVTSDFDKNSPELEAKNFFAFKQYRAFLRNHGVNHTGVVVTKMRFDPTVAYPKIVFGPDRVVEPDELAMLEESFDPEQIERLLAGFTPEGPDGAPGDGDSAKKEKPDLPDADDGDGADDKAEAELAAKKKAAEAAKKAAATRKANKEAAEKKAAAEAEAKKPKKKSSDDEDDDFENLGKALSEEPKAPDTSATDVSESDDNDLDALLSEWDD